MNRIVFSLVMLISLAGLLQAEVKTEFGGGYKVGYSMGQYGRNWPDFDEPLKNENRRGFYLNDLLVNGKVIFDSTFSGSVLLNMNGSVVEEAYIEKRAWDFLFTAGKFRGAGLKSNQLFTEYNRDFIQLPWYYHHWGAVHERWNGRDYGVQAGRSFFKNKLRLNLFLHNGNRSVPQPASWDTTDAGPVDAASIDLGVDWTPSPGLLIGGHAGARAMYSWRELLGNHSWWQAQYWFKSNRTTSSSVYFKMDRSRLHMFNEALLTSWTLPWQHPDTKRNKIDQTAQWSISTHLGFDVSNYFKPVLGYMFADLTDGNIAHPVFRDDGLHQIMAGMVFRPSPASYPDLKVITEYTHNMEEAESPLQQNDVFYVQLQQKF